MTNLHQRIAAVRFAQDTERAALRAKTQQLIKTIKEALRLMEVAHKQVFDYPGEPPMLSNANALLLNAHRLVENAHGWAEKHYTSL